MARVASCFRVPAQVIYMAPLSLPVGSVRALLALTVVVGTMAMYWCIGSVPNEIWMAFGLAIQGYFSARQPEAK